MKRETKNRIPIRFVDEDGSNARSGGGEDDQSSLEEQNAASDLMAGRAATNDNAIEAGRGIDNDPKQATTGGRERIDAFDVAAAFDQADSPETGHRGSTISPVDNQNSTADTFGDDAQTAGTSQQAGAATGPAFAELLATRAELARVEADLRKAAAERQDAINRLARLQADFENSRKRFERERSETYNRVLGEIVGRLLPVTDNLRRALHARESMQTDDSAEFRHFLQGIGLINKQLSGLLESLGVETVATVGQHFDPHIHEAAATEQTDQFPPDTVIEEVVPGYVLGGKLLRPAMVKVATR